jgi:general secretion pathway protein N
MPNRYAWIALGAGAYLAFALSMMPAATVYRLFAPDALRLAGVDGTLWSGSATLGSAGGLPMRDIVWRVEALPLLTGRVAARVQARLADGFIETDVSAGVGGVVLDDLRGSTSVPALTPLVPLQGVDGLVSVSMRRLRLEDGWPTEAVGEARIAELRVPPLLSRGAADELISLGNYEIAFDDAPSGIAARIRDTGGPLEVDGTLTLSADRRYALEGRAAARPDAPPEVIQGLDLMAGEPDAEGKRAFSLTGSL